jgi:hypothetical protein
MSFTLNPLALWLLRSPREVAERQLHNARMDLLSHTAQAEHHEAMRKMLIERIERLEHDLTPESYECHITVSVKDAELATHVAKRFNCKTSEIARDPVLGDDTFFYLTFHTTDYVQALGKMETVCIQLQEVQKVNVIRKKIEKIVYDTKGKK